jgi:hypothetical protein
VTAKLIARLHLDTLAEIDECLAEAASHKPRWMNGRQGEDWRRWANELLDRRLKAEQGR